VHRCRLTCTTLSSQAVRAWSSVATRHVEVNGVAPWGEWVRLLRARVLVTDAAALARRYGDAKVANRDIRLFLAFRKE
jgi:hypothetical protein